MDKLLAMEVFVASVDLGTFAAAGESLKISPPMVSKHIRDLEQSLGTNLIVRTTRRSHLTEAGERYYESCKSILEDVRNAESGAQELSAQPKGKLRINASVAFGRVLAPIVADYLNANPEVTVELTLNNRFVDIVDEGFDLAVRIGKLEDSTLVARKLGNYDLTICASPEYLKLHGTPETPEDLINHKCLGFTLWRNQSGWRQFLSKSSHLPATRFESNDVDALHMAAVKGVGLLLIPRSLINEDIKSERLVEILQNHLPASMPINVVYPKTQQKTPKLNSFVEFILEHFRNSHPLLN